MTGLAAIASGWVTLGERLADMPRDPEALVLAYEDAVALPEWHPDRESLVRCLRWRLRTARGPDGSYVWQPGGPLGLGGYGGSDPAISGGFVPELEELPAGGSRSVARVTPGETVLARRMLRDASPFRMPKMDEVPRW